VCVCVCVKGCAVSCLQAADVMFFSSLPVNINTSYAPPLQASRTPYRKAQGACVELVSLTLIKP
jgi:hypothetical protein